MTRSPGARLFARLLKGAQELDPALASWMERNRHLLEPMVIEAYEAKRMRLAASEIADDGRPASEWWDIKRKRQRFADLVERKAPVGGIYALPDLNLSKVALDMLATGELIRQGNYILPGRRAPDRTTAMPEDIDRARAVRAFEGTSQFPERRGESTRLDYARSFNAWAQSMRMKADDAGGPWLEQELENARLAYLGAVRSYLGSKASTTSWHVTGPAGRNERREQKKHDSADRRMAEVQAILPQAGKRLKREMETQRLEQAADEREALRQQAIQAYEDLTNAAVAGAGFTPYLDKRRESLRREVERLGGFGPTRERPAVGHEARRRRGELLRAEARLQHAGTSTEARAAAARAATLKAREAATGEQEFEFPAHTWKHYGGDHEIPSGTLWVDYDRDRLRMAFDERMGDAWKAVKSAGWNWSRRDQEFLRKITGNALYSARAITGLALELPEYEARVAAVQAAEDAAAARVQEARKAKAAAARAGTGSFAEVLTAAMRKGAQFKVTIPSSLETPKAGKKLSPSVRKGPQRGWVLAYKTGEQAPNPFGGGGMRPGLRNFTVVALRSGNDVSLQLYASGGWRLEPDALVDQAVVSGAYALGGQGVPAVTDAIAQMIKAATLRKAALDVIRS